MDPLPPRALSRPSLAAHPEGPPMPRHQEDHPLTLEQLRELAGEATVHDDRNEEDELC